MQRAFRVWRIDMFSGKLGRRTLTHVLMALAIVVLAVPAFAQTGRIQGKVTDEAGKPVDGAKITVSTIPDTGGQKWEATSDKNGYYNIGVSEVQLKDYDKAEAAYKKAIELRPSYPEAYNALAAMYTSQKKMDLAAAAASKAAELSAATPGGGSPDSMYSAGVGLWNANKFPEAQAA